MQGMIPALAALATAIAIGGCNKVTYPKEQVLDSLVQVCEREYNVKVSAKVVGTNLGVHLNFSSLFTNEFDFKEEAMEILEDVLTSVRRVSLSTDSDFEFYTIVGSDLNNGVELVLTRFILDMKKVMYGNIGRNDYSQRMILRVRPDVYLLGERKLRSFFADMTTGKMERIIGANFAPGTNLQDISSDFFLMLLELGMKEDIRFQIRDVQYLPADKEEGIFYVTVQEDYQPKAGYEANAFAYPSGTENHFLFRVTCKDFTPAIQKIVPLKTDSAKSTDFPPEFSRYPDVADWPDRAFYLDEVNMPGFLAHQIAQRVRARINADDEMKDSLRIENVEGSYQSLHRDSIEDREVSVGRQDLELTLQFKRRPAIEGASLRPVPQGLVDISLDVVREVCKSYRFEDFGKVRLLGINNEELYSLDARPFIP